MANEIEDDAEEVEGDGGGSSKKKLLIFGIIGGLLFAAVGAFGASMFLGGDEAVEEVDAAEVAEDAEPRVKYAYIEVPRMPAPIMNARGRVVGYYMIDLTIELVDEKHISQVFNLMPRIQNAFTQAISRNGVSLPEDPGTIDFDGLKKRLTSAANEAIGEEVASDVLIARVQRTS